MKEEGTTSWSYTTTKLGDSPFCSIMCIEDKRFSLVFPEGNVFQGDWKTLASKLRNINVVPEARPMEEFKDSVRLWEDKGGGILPKLVSYAKVLDKDKRFLGDAMWIKSEIEEVFKNVKSLKNSLVGRWDRPSNQASILDLLKLWA